jgi:hypothetical protein
MRGDPDHPTAKAGIPLPAKILDFSKFRHRWIVGGVEYSYPASDDRQGGSSNPESEGCEGEFSPQICSESSEPKNAITLGIDESFQKASSLS